MNGRCPRGETLSALLDQALTTSAREKVQKHLLDCSHCRAELAELRRLRTMMTRPRPRTDATPSSLTDRLVGIAGEDASLPLNARSFTSPGGVLPTRQRRNRRMLVVAAVLATTLVAFVGIGWAAAPPVQTAALDPGSNRDELAAVLADLPLGMDATAAVLSVTDLVELHSTDRVPEPTWTSNDASSTRPLGEGEALAALSRAADARHQVAVSGRQAAWIAQGEQSLHAIADVQRQPGQGAEVALRTSGGGTVANGYLPAPDVTIGVPTSYRLAGLAKAGTLLDRDVSLVEARSTDAGATVARWWIDQATGLVLWQTLAGADGRLIESAGFTSFATTPDAFVSHLPVRLNTASAPDLHLAMRAELSAAGWACAGELGGLPLVKLRGNAGTTGNSGTSRTDGEGVHTVYTDGIDTLVVSQQRGALGTTPEGYTWDATIRAYRADGPVTELTWQSGNRVFTVTAFGSGERLDEAIGLLPHDPPLLRTRIERVQAGWHHILTGSQAGIP